MTDIMDPKRRSDLMAGIRSRDTAPELKVRRIAHRMGLRFRLHRKDLPGRPDLVFPKHRLAVFVHGCFWHRHQGCPRASTPKTRTAFWNAKLAANVTRDVRHEASLKALGWRVLVIWECEAGHRTTVERKLAALCRDEGFGPDTGEHPLDCNRGIPRLDTGIGNTGTAPDGVDPGLVRGKRDEACLG